MFQKALAQRAAQNVLKSVLLAEHSVLWGELNGTSTIIDMKRKHEETANRNNQISDFLIGLRIREYAN